MRDIIIRKTIVLSIIGLLCLIVGIVYGLAANDKTLIIMSVIICAVNIHKILELRQIEKHNKYTVISGICLESVYKLVGKYRILRIKDNDDIVEISVPKSVKLKVNEKYNLYFKKSTTDPKGCGEWLNNKILSENFLGYERIDCCSNE